MASVGRAELWQAVQGLRLELTPDGPVNGDEAKGMWEGWCERQGIDFDDLQSIAEDYFPGFVHWLDVGQPLPQAVVNMWLHGFQVGLRVGQAGWCEVPGGHDA